MGNFETVEEKPIEEDQEAIDSDDEGGVCSLFGGSNKPKPPPKVDPLLEGLEDIQTEKKVKKKKKRISKMN